jgi:protein-L-isoaspartate(D-aspartate) O-methyltransferase
MRARWPLLLASLALGCHMQRERPPDAWSEARANMVREQIAGRGIRDPRVLAALARVPRHELVPEALREFAYADQPLPIGYEQTISQPFVVAYMTEQLQLRGDERVLEIGTGSGYQAAVLSLLAREVYSIEIVKELGERARADLARLGYANVHVRVGDGYRGWPEQAPFDAIIVTAAPGRVPQPLIDQLAVGGRLVLPVGGFDQQLLRIDRDATGLRREHLIGVRFVPMRGEAQTQE